MQRRKPRIDILAGLVLGIAVSPLERAFELITFAVDCADVVVRQLAPFLLDLALHLLPITFHSVPVHLLFSLACC